MNEPTVQKFEEDGADSRPDSTHRQTGVPLARGPSGPLRRMGEFLARPEVRVWQAPALKVIGVCAVISCLAFVGGRAAEEEAYGPRMNVDVMAHPKAPGPGQSESGRGEGAHLAQTASGKALASSAPPSTTPASAAPAPCVDPAAPPKPSAILPDGRVVLNEATEVELTRLPGVGPARARAILELRERLGGFRKVTDLLRVKGIGYKSLERIKAHLVLSRPESSEDQPVSEPSGAASPGSAVKSTSNDGEKSNSSKKAP